MSNRNTYKIDPAEEWQEGHFFVSSVAEWHTGRDAEGLIKAMRREPFPFALWFVPLPENAAYKIKNYGPEESTGAVQVASYGLA